MKRQPAGQRRAAILAKVGTNDVRTINAQALLQNPYTKPDI